MAQSRYFESRRLLAGAVWALLIPHQCLAQSHSGFPVDIIAGPAP